MRTREVYAGAKVVGFKEITQITTTLSETIKQRKKAQYLQQIITIGSIIFKPCKLFNYV